MSIYAKIFGSTADTSADTVANATYSNVRNSTTNTTGAANTASQVGQRFTTNYTIGQIFAVFDTSTVPAGAGTGSLTFNCSVAALAGDNLEVREVPALTNKIAGDSLAAFPLYGSLAVPTTTGLKTFTISDITGLSRSTSLKLLIHSENERLNIAPTVGNKPTFDLANITGTTNDPTLTLLAGTAWDFIGAGTNVQATTTAHTLTEPAGVAAGDLLVACIGSRIASFTALTLPTGWTLVHQNNDNNVLATSGGRATGTMAYIIRGASPPNYTFTHPVAPDVALGRVVAYRNVHQTTPLDVAVFGGTATATLACSWAGLPTPMTTTADDDLIVAMVAGGQEAAYSGFNATDPGTSSGTTAASVLDPIWGQWLERAEQVTTTGADTSLAIFDGVKQTAGAVGTFVATATVSASHTLVAGSFKLAPSGPPAIVGTASITLNALTAVGSGTVTDPVPIEGTADITLGALTATATGKVLVQGQLSGAAAYGPDQSAHTDTTQLPDNFPDATLGAVVTFATAGQVTGVRYWRVAAATAAARNVALWSPVGPTLLATATGANDGAITGWVTVSFAVPYDVAAGTEYVVAVNNPDQYGFYEVTSPLVNGDITLVKDTYAAGFDQYPADDYGAGYTAFTDVVFRAVTGAGGYELGALALAAAGTVADPVTISTGTLSVTLGALTAVATGSVANQVFTGTLSATLGTLTAAGIGKVPAQGTLSATLGAATLAATGKVPAQGTFAATLDAVVLAATGTVAAPSGLAGTLSVTLDAATLAATGTVTQTVRTGTLAATLGAATLAATGKVPAQGTLSATLGALALAGAGTVAQTVRSGTLAATLGPVTLASIGTIPARGTASITLGALALAGTGTVVSPPRTATLAATLGDLTLTSAGAVTTPARTGTLGVTLGSLSLVSSSSPVSVGSLSVTLGAATLAASGSLGPVPRTGTLAVTLGALTLTATAKQSTAGTMAATLGPLVLSAIGKVPAQATLGTTLGELLLAATGRTPIKGTLGTTLGALQLEALGRLPAQAQAAITLGALTLLAEGRSGQLPTAETIDLVGVIDSTETLIGHFARASGFIGTLSGPATLQGKLTKPTTLIGRRLTNVSL